MELKISHLSKHYGDKRALEDVSISLNEGIYGLLGPNGAGKSTLMGIVTGNIRPDDGCVFLDGCDIRSLGEKYRSRLGYMPQQQVFYPGFTVERFLFYLASLRGIDKKTTTNRIEWALEILALSDVRKKKIRTLSGGTKQRLLLAQAILADPDILILDEPTAGLDPKQRIAVRNLIAKIALKKIVLISTHMVSDVEFVAKELILLSGGRVLQKTAPHTLLQSLNGTIWEVIVPEEKLDALSQFGTICAISKGENGALVRLMAEEAPPFACAAAHPNLEDVYLRFFGVEEGL